VEGDRKLELTRDAIGLCQEPDEGILTQSWPGMRNRYRVSGEVSNNES
jgi:hypothetical protein